MSGQPTGFNGAIPSELRGVNKALRAVLRSFQTVQTVSGQAMNVRSIREARVEMLSFSAALDQAEKEKGKGSNFGGFANALKSMLPDTKTSVKKAIEMADAWSMISVQMSGIAREGENVDEIQQKVFTSANRARTSYADMAGAVSRFGAQAGGSFGSTDELIAFSENLSKLYSIGGASQEAQESSMSALAQAMSDGILSGEELNSVFGTAPDIVRTMADSLGVPLESFRSMAEEGQITSEIIKNAILGATEEVNREFASTPMTFGQAFTIFSNQALMALEPIWQKLGEISSSEGFLSFVNSAGQALATVANLAVTVLDVLSGVAGFVADNWSVLAPIIGGVVAALGLYLLYLGYTKTAEMAGKAAKLLLCFASYAHAAFTKKEASETAKATAAQYGLNAALLACPLTWILLIIIAVIAAIYAIVAAINKVTGSSISATGVIMGALAVAASFIGNLFFGLIELVLGIVNAFLNPFGYLANFLANVFVDPIGSIIHLFGDMADWVLAILQKIASAIDLIFGSNLAETVSDWRGSLNAKVEEASGKYGNGKYKEVMEEVDLSVAGLGLERFDYGTSWDKSYDFGGNLEDKVSGFFSGNENGGFDTALDYQGTLDSIGSGVGQTAANTGRGVDISDENLVYIRDLAEQEAVNRFTTSEIRVDMVNNNNVSSNMDLDGIMNYLAVGVNAAIGNAAEGVHE